MSHAGGIYVMGDVHAEFGLLNTFIHRKRPSLILQCGDFGYWPRIPARDRRGRIRPRRPVIAGDTRVHFCDGNHEDHWSLGALAGPEIFPNVFYMKRGSTLVLPDGRTVLFVGGAASVDRNWRTPGHDWFPEETLATEDIADLPEQRVDIVVSHTCPVEFAVCADTERARDPSRLALSHVLQRCRPTRWFFGHFHSYQTGNTLGCQWTALDMAGNPKWWEALPDAG